MTEELLLEIGTEEIPAAFLPDALAALKTLMEQELVASRIGFDSIQTYGTPRRLVLMGRGVAARQEDLVVCKTGPARDIAFDKNGRPTKAALGFARSQGVDVELLSVVETDKGAYICAERKEAGASAERVLAELLPRVISAIPFPKSMRWHDLELRFARPVHWIAALFKGVVVPFVLGNVKSGGTSFGHRFMAPGPVAVSGIESYSRAMEKAFVVIDPALRQERIVSGARDLAAGVGGRLDEDERLVREVTYLVESPFPVLCSFSEQFLTLPRAVLLTTMKKHQRYFPVLDKNGDPLPYFVAVNNTGTIEPRISISGHERVLSARLADAQFFYAEDQKRSLDAMTESLRQVVFQSRLGTSYEKMERFRKLALFITETFVNPAVKATVERAAYLCKADLVSEMVGEFPELQGIMGREYACLGGETNEVCRAVFEHYLPRFAGDELPATDAGAAISIADKMDTIVGCFGIGLVPSGTADPYALRRQCLGIINIILHNKYIISLSETVSRALTFLADKITRPRDEIHADIMKFFSTRLANLLISRGLAYDSVEAVICLGADNLSDTVERIEALEHMKRDPDFESLAVSFKRVANIIAGQPCGSVDPTLFQQEEEKALYDTYLEVRDRIQELLEQKAYREALKLVATIRGTVDRFFDNVMVMTPEEHLQHNRLALLGSVNALFIDFADFSRIASD